MKGDIDTLKKVCKYASTVMFLGTVAFGCLIVATLILGLISLFWSAVVDLLSWWIGLTFGIDEGTSILPAYLYTLLFLILAFVTVFAVYRIMMSIQNDDSPFTEKNSEYLMVVSKTYLVATIPFAVVGYFTQGNMPMAVYICLGCILVCVVMYCLSIVFRYGVDLQDLSDGTI